MRKFLSLIAAVGSLFWAPRVTATVFINEAVFNPPGSLDDFREYIELLGTPGKKLDGYAVVFMNGTEDKYYALNSIPPLPSPTPEIDEFFSLDGLSLGANGLLVLAIANRTNYPEVLTDTAFIGPWTSLWNGQLDIPGKLQNDGSNTILLIRNRPGATQAAPTQSGGLRWAKGLWHDFELIKPVRDPQDGVLKDQFGDGDLDHGQPSGIGRPTFDMTGESTPDDVQDDLEVVDELSYEHTRGWEYDIDDRMADIGSAIVGLPPRRVHALDDPQGFNPDALTRVDYRTTGQGWQPESGATGEMANGRNWQDTATEQWIRGETSAFFGDEGPEVYYDNSSNVGTDSIQPYLTNVPRWLANGTAPDYSFDSDYPTLAGRLNPLAIPFIPGDADRDGDCDAQDIAKVAGVFGDDNWIFSNSFAEAEHGHDGDPAAQTRPWDVDATGDQGIEASDLQWTLNFQGNTSGRIVGVRYDSTTPSAVGVFLGPHTGVHTTFSVVSQVTNGHPLNNLAVGDVVELTVRGQVTAGARTHPADQANGIMQFVQDAVLGTAGVLRVDSVEAVAPFTATRPELVAPQGMDGDQGVHLIQGYATLFTLGLGSPAPLYKLRLRAIGLGSAQVSLRRASAEKFAASTPHGVKLGHTQQFGNPAGSTYPSPLTLTVTTVPEIVGNCDDDPAVGLVDHECFLNCMNGPDASISAPCTRMDFDSEQDVDLKDWGAFENAFGEP